jgi:hypothetical protein
MRGSALWNRSGNSTEVPHFVRSDCPLPASRAIARESLGGVSQQVIVGAEVVARIESNRITQEQCRRAAQGVIPLNRWNADGDVGV